MKKTIGLGIQSFAKLLEGNYFYIDKTAFIKEWWESGDDVTLITRPRRFGKTLNMSMIEHFFSVDYADKGELFKGLSIWKEEKYRQIQGTYPVISISFANIKEDNYQTTKEKIFQLIKNLYSKYEFLLESDAMTISDKAFIRKIFEDMKDVEATMALHQLSKCLYQYYQKKVIILLDEYDAPMQEAYVYGYWQELVTFTRSMFNAAFKTNPYLARGIMTGITRVSKESIFSDLNHLKVVTTTSDEYAAAFGFTEEEVFVTLEEYGLEKEKEEVKNWYDGFVFGEQRDIYNPWSILNYLDTGKLENYWANTSANSLVAKLVREGNKNIKMSFERLLNGETIRCPIDEQIVYNQLNNSETAVFSMLVASGYLKVLGYENRKFIGAREPLYDLKLTNNEVKIMFYNMVHNWFAEAEEDYNEFVKALLQGNVREMNDYMNEVALSVFSYFDTGRSSYRKETERFYHGFVLGLLVELNEKYVITSNRESGFGRYDVMLEPIDSKNDAIILEFKVRDLRDEKTLQETVATALQQIEDKKYEAVLLAKGILAERIRKYGFAFEGKKVLIG